MGSQPPYSKGRYSAGGTRPPQLDHVERPEPVGAGTRIVIVDDEELLRAVQADFLRRFGFEVRAAESARAALAMLAAAPADILITDMVMPDTDGVELIRHMRKLHPQVRIIAISGGSGATRRELLLDVARVLGVNRTLEKPFTLTALLKAIREVLAEPHGAGHRRADSGLPPV